MASMGWFLAVCLVLTQADATSTQYRANPIRKVVSLMMGMQKQVQAEGKQTRALYDKFMCNAKNVKASLTKSIKEGEERLPQLESGIKELKGEHEQLAQDLKSSLEDRERARKAVATATSLRNKNARDFAKESTGQKADAKQCAIAIAHVKKAQEGGAFLQSKESSFLRRLAASTDLDLSDVDRDMITSFLEGGAQQPSSGEVLGILSEMHRQMRKELDDMQRNENAAIADHEALVTAKSKEIKATSKAIEVKSGRKGSVAVGLTKLKNDFEDTTQSLAGDKKFIGETMQAEGIKQQEFDAYKKNQGDELVALADTIKLLNDDAALTLFKKTSASASASSFLQMPVTHRQVRHDALRALHHVRRHAHGDQRLALLSLAIQGRKGGSFDVVLRKLDKLVVNLHKEQSVDSDKKAWCLAEVDKTEDEVKWSKRSVSDVRKVIASANEEFKAILGEIVGLTQGIKELDVSVTSATKQRKAESVLAQKSLAESGSAKELLQMASNRLKKFYRPSLFQRKRKAALLQYKKKDGGENGVLRMINILKADLTKQMQEIASEEKEAQKDYEIFMKDSTDKRAIDAKGLADKASAKSKVETELQKGKDKFKGERESVKESKQELGELHGDCDSLIKNFDARAKARVDEIDALKKSRAVLSGASYE